MKSKIVAAVLAFFLGSLGVDYFYLGNMKMGIIILIVGVLSLGLSILGIGLIVGLLLVIYAWVRAITYLIKSEETFNKVCVVKPVAK